MGKPGSSTSFHPNKNVPLPGYQMMLYCNDRLTREAKPSIDMVDPKTNGSLLCKRIVQDTISLTSAELDPLGSGTVV